VTPRRYRFGRVRDSPHTERRNDFTTFRPAKTWYYATGARVCVFRRSRRRAGFSFCTGRRTQNFIIRDRIYRASNFLTLFQNRRRIFNWNPPRLFARVYIGAAATPGFFFFFNTIYAYADFAYVHIRARYYNILYVQTYTCIKRKREREREQKKEEASIKKRICPPSLLYCVYEYFPGHSTFSPFQRVYTRIDIYIYITRCSARTDFPNEGHPPHMYEQKKLYIYIYAYETKNVCVCVYTHGT